MRVDSYQKKNKYLKILIYTGREEIKTKFNFDNLQIYKQLNFEKVVLYRNIKNSFWTKKYEIKGTKNFQRNKKKEIGWSFLVIELHPYCVFPLSLNCSKHLKI